MCFLYASGRVLAWIDLPGRVDDHLDLVTEERVDVAEKRANLLQFLHRRGTDRTIFDRVHGVKILNSSISYHRPSQVREAEMDLHHLYRSGLHL